MTDHPIPTRLRLEELEPREVPAAAYDTLPVLPALDPAVVEHVRMIAALGNQLGRRTDVFMKVGDSNTATGGLGVPQYLTPLGAADYDPNLSGLAAIDRGLVDTLAAFDSIVDPAGANSFTRVSTAAFPGWDLTKVMPHLLEEADATRAGLALVEIGGNDVITYRDPATYRALLRQLVGTLTAAGVVPVLSTIPYRFDLPELPGRIRVFNQVVADVADEFRVPVWNLARALEALPSAGIGPDHVHLGWAPGGGGSFGAGDLQYGQNLRNLEALQVLSWLHTVTAGVGEAPALLPTWTPLPTGRGVVAAGAGPGDAPVVSVYDTVTGALLNRVRPFEASFFGGVRVAVADVNRDGFQDVVAVPGAGGGSVVVIVSGKDGAVLARGFVFGPTFRGGLNVAAADLDGDGAAEVVLGAATDAPHVIVLHGGDMGVVSSFFAFDPQFTGGVTVGAGTFAGIGPAVVAGAGVGGGPVVRVFRYGAVEPVAGWLVGDAGDRSGAAVAAGDLTGDGRAELVAAAGGRVRVLDAATGAVLADHAVGGMGAVRPAVAGGLLLVGNGLGTATTLRAYRGLGDESFALFAEPGSSSAVNPG